MRLSRRTFLGSCSLLGAGAFLGGGAVHAAASPRRYHLSISIEALEKEPERLEIFAKSGGNTVWLPGFFYGAWPVPLEKVMEWRGRAEKLGLPCHVINIPLGHPGDSLGSSDANFRLTPTGWKFARRPDGSQYSGTSLHPPAVGENAAAVARLRDAGVRTVFLDDDFRLAVGPGVIGGCFCDEHKREFLEVFGFSESDWQTLLADVAGRNPSKILHAWVEWTCDQLTGCFKAMQAAAPEVELGNMIMYLGAEKAGIRLRDYRDAPFRVGELMFDDNSFGTPKGKTNELFSCLFHRRFAAPEKAHSETTAYPADKLSAANMAAKLAVSTIADVRNTMYMSGLTAFPIGHWDTLGPAMKTHAEIHARLAGHAPAGPFKHYWGENSRYAGDDNPYSLFLALGVPFETVEKMPENGVVFLSDADAPEAAGEGNAVCVARPGKTAGNARAVGENLDELFSLRRELLPTLAKVPHVVEEKPVVCAWYPTARAVLLWNLAETPEKVTLRAGRTDIPADLPPLGVALLENVDCG